MKIAIQANPSRGKEIISLLESLGGSNPKFKGDGERYTYYIDNDSIIRYDYAPIDYKVYTLEEFEKEFPFKIGDIILIKGVNTPNKIITLEWYTNKLCYKLDNGLHYAPERLTTYKEVKEERNITLTLDKAKEWYKKGGELREIALQAFTEKELNPLPKTWEEFCEKYPIREGECFLGFEDKINVTILHDYRRRYKNWIPSKKSAEAHLAMIQLEQLRDCWRQGVVPQGVVYKIKKIRNKHTVVCGADDVFLSFCNLQTAKEFLECFRDLIEQAGDLI